MAQMLGKAHDFRVRSGCRAGCCLRGYRPRRVARAREKREWQRESAHTRTS